MIFYLTVGIHLCHYKKYIYNDLRTDQYFSRMSTHSNHINNGRTDTTEYFQMAISVDCVLFGFENNELKVLLIKSDLEEFKGQWSLLGDLVRPNENLDSASYRVLKERTGLDDVYLEQVHTFGDVNRHPVGRVITTAYFSLVNIKNHQLKLSHNELHWHPVFDITSMAFDHKLIMDTCLRQLQERIEEQPVVFNLLPEKFSLRELQNLYEAILGIKMDRRNFRKKFFLMDWLVDVDEMEQDVPHRPGKLYRFNSGKFSAGNGYSKILPSYFNSTGSVTTEEEV